MKRTILISTLLLVVHLVHAPCVEAQILASPVVDVANNTIGAIGKVVARMSRTVREEILPWKERISKVQDFFKKASETVNAVVRNLRMVNQLIQIEKDIRSLFVSSMRSLNESDTFLDKWKYLQIMTQLYAESLTVFKVFEISTEEGQGILDDKSRIILLRDTLVKARRIKQSMKAVIRRANQNFAKIEKTQKELAVFDRLFGPQ